MYLIQKLAFIILFFALNSQSYSVEAPPCADITSTHALQQIGITETRPISRSPSPIGVGIPSSPAIMEGDRLLIKFKPSTATWRVELKPSKNSTAIFYDHNSRPGNNGYFMTPELKEGAMIRLTDGIVALEKKLLFSNNFMPSRPLSAFFERGKQRKPNFTKIDEYLSNQTNSTKRTLADNIAQSMAYLVNIERSGSVYTLDKGINVGVSSCTSFFVAKDIIATNRHCVMSCDREGPVSSLLLWIRSAQKNSAEAPLIQNAELITPPANKTHTKESKEIDVVFLKVNYESSNFLTFASSSPPLYKKLTIFQYPFDENGIALPSLRVNDDAQCIVCANTSSNGFMEGYINHKCDSGSSSSGSPIFNYNLDKGVVAVHNIGSESPNSGENKAVPVESILQLVSDYYPNISIQAQKKSSFENDPNETNDLCKEY